MARNFLRPFVALVFSAALAGAAEAEVYSCSTEIQLWTEANLVPIATMSRSSLVALPLEYQQAAFRAMPLSQRHAIWASKVAAVRAMSWNATQNVLLDDLAAAMTPAWFGSQQAYAEEWVTHWTNVAYRFFPAPVVRQIVGSPADLGSPPPSTALISPYELKSCGCNRGMDFCDTLTGPADTCKAITCRAGLGCGLIWLQTCNGLCALSASLTSYVSVAQQPPVASCTPAP